MKKIFGIILFLIAFAIGADVKPFVFENVALDDSAQQAEWDLLMKYKIYGQNGITFKGGRIFVPDKSGWFGTSQGDFDVSGGNQDHLVGGPILIGGNMMFNDGHDTISTGPVRVLGNVTVSNFNPTNIINGTQCISGTVAQKYINEVPVENRYFGENYDSCPPEVPYIDTNLTIPVFLDTFTYNTGINLNNDTDYIDVPIGEGTYDYYINNISMTNNSRLVIRMPLGGRLTRIFIKEGFLFSAHPKISIMYMAEDAKYIDGHWTGSGSIINNKDYSGNLLFYTTKDIIWPAIHSTDSIQGTFITTGQISIEQHMTLAGQLLANKISINFNFDGSGFLYVPFDPPVLNIDPTALANGRFVENNKNVIIPIHLDTLAKTDVYFKYCFILDDKVTQDDFNVAVPECNSNIDSVFIPAGDSLPKNNIYLNVKTDGISEGDEILKFHIFDLQGAVMPGNVKSGDFKLILTDPFGFGIDTTWNYSFFENDSGLVDKIRVIGKSDSTKFILDSAAHGIYTLDSITGELTLTKPLDHELVPFDTIKVTVTDTSGLTDTRYIPITINDINEAPSIEDQTLTLSENLPISSKVGTVVVFDQDIDTTFRKNNFKIIEGDTSTFVINNNGQIYANKKFNYETDDTVYTLKIKVYDKTDTTLSDIATITIKITDANDRPKLQPNDTLNVPENCNKNCEAGKVIAIDPDNDPITYTIKEPGFTINSNGVITVNNSFDHEKDSIITITVIARDSLGLSDTAKYTIKITDVDEPVHAHDMTITVPENVKDTIIGKVTGEDEDGDSVKFYSNDTLHYVVDSITGIIRLVEPFDYEKIKTDTLKVIVKDVNGNTDTATVVINIDNVNETVEITYVDDHLKVDTIKTNNPNHNIDWLLCEGTNCDSNKVDLEIRRDTIVKVCNENKTSCDSVVFLFNDAPPVVTLTNANSTNALIDYITIEEEKDDKIYVNKKNNEITVTVKDTIHKTEKHFNIDVTLDTIATKDIKLTEYNYIIDETKAKVVPIGNNLAELVEVIKVDGIEVELKQVIDMKTGKPVDTVQTVTYTKKVGEKNVVVSYKIDNLSSQKITDYEVSYMIDSCTKVTYSVDDNKKIVKNKEGNIAYTIAYEYTDDYGNKASANVEIIFDNIPPKVEILNPIAMESFNTNAIPVKWTVNGEVQDTLTLQRLEKGINHIIRRYVDKAGNVAEDTITVIMREAKDIEIKLVHPVTIVDKDKVDAYYSEGHKYNDKKPYDVKFVDPKNDTLPDVIGVGFKIDIVLPSVSPTGSLATLDDITKNGQIPVDDNGNIVGASTHGIPVDQYVEEHCTEEFQKDYQKYGLNIPLYDVKYNLHLWVYTNAANYVNDFNIEFTLNDEAKTTSAGTVQMVIDWLADRDGTVKAKNKHALGTGAYLTKLYSKSIAKHRCDYKEQRKGDKTVKKDETMKTFGFKRPNKK